MRTRQDYRSYYKGMTIKGLKEQRSKLKDRALLDCINASRDLSYVERLIAVREGKRTTLNDK